MLLMGKSHKGDLPPLTPEEAAASVRLKADVMMLAGTIGERNTDNHQQLCIAADFITDRFRKWGLVVRRDEYVVNGLPVANVEAELAGGKRGDGVIIVGAHYDSPPNSAGADDNASGVAALMELALRFGHIAKPKHTIRFVAFVNEEPPYFQTDLMGSRVYARRAKERGEKIKAMLCLDCIGYYSDNAGSQLYPPPLDMFYPNTADFISFIGNIRSSLLLRRCIKTFRDTTHFPSEGLVGPESIQGVGWSDHWSFWQEGYPAIMITDTAHLRNRHYHLLTDTPEKLDYERMARVVVGIGNIVERFM
jgi:hypothetical protein